MELKDRFLKYVSFDTQSNEESQTFPSTDKQLVLLNYLADEINMVMRWVQSPHRRAMRMHP